MSMSMFSAFEALCAESLFGQRVGFPPLSNNAIKQSPAVEIGGVKKGKEVNSFALQPEKEKDCRKISAPKFAPELDGVQWFENILP